ncbi:MAG: gamma-butyrobetaine hydroxylase-like domain-containing protein [Pseudomonadota bacterium]
MHGGCTDANCQGQFGRCRRTGRLDGRTETVDYFWLRDNCRRPSCGDKSGGHRYLEPGEIPFDIPPASIQLAASGELWIRWAPDGHESEYAPDAALTFRLEAGDAVPFDDHRVLHARLGFCGTRHIRQCHAERGEYLSRLRISRSAHQPWSG